MSLKIGIVGLPNVGKSSLFNALLKREQALVANYPFATIEPNIGVVSVPDERLDKLANWFNPQNPPPMIPTQITFVDIAGLVKGAAKGEGLGNKFLSHIKSADMMLEVIRDFESPDIAREHSKNPEDDAEIIDAELRLKDLETIEKRLAALKKDPSKKEESNFLLQIKEKISSLDEIKLPENEIKNKDVSALLKELNLLSLKPKIYAFNTDAEKLLQKNSLPASRNGKAIIHFSAKTPPKFAKQSLGGQAGAGLERLIKKCYETLNLISFLTVGEKEARAWQVRNGSTAREAAGAIHSDFEKNFIRAKVINWLDLTATKSFADASGKGLVRTEGKNYIVEDGDVLEVLAG